MRFSSKRFKFDAWPYIGDDQIPMRHIKVYCEGAMQVDLWLDPEDVGALKKALDFVQAISREGENN